MKYKVVTVHNKKGQCFPVNVEEICGNTIIEAIETFKIKCKADLEDLTPGVDLKLVPEFFKYSQECPDVLVLTGYSIALFIKEGDEFFNLADEYAIWDYETADAFSDLVEASTTPRREIL